MKLRLKNFLKSRKKEFRYIALSKVSFFIKKSNKYFTNILHLPPPQFPSPQLPTTTPKYSHCFQQH